MNVNRIFNAISSGQRSHYSMTKAKEDISNLERLPLHVPFNDHHAITHNQLATGFFKGRKETLQEIPDSLAIKV